MILCLASWAIRQLSFRINDQCNLEFLVLSLSINPIELEEDGEGKNWIQEVESATD